MYDFDVIVLGAGPGGYPAAIRAAQLGKKTAIIEKECWGGTCLNWGCIPTKSLLASAQVYLQTTQTAAYGVAVTESSFDYAQMVARKDRIVTRLTSGIQMLLESNGVTMLQGTARFSDPHTVTVQDDASKPQAYSAAHIIIATGSDSSLPGFLPQSPRILESRAFLELTTLPASLLVLGGGVIGCEFACMAAALGTKVTMVEMLDQIIAPLDRDIRRPLLKQMQALGIEVITGSALNEINVDAQGVRGQCGQRQLEAEMLLVAIGRKPNTGALNLAAAGVTTDERGYIPVDAQGRSNIASIFAIGDLTSGSIQLAHAATQQGLTAAEALAGKRAQVEAICPSCIFTLPEIGLVGLSETQAATQNIAVKSASFPFAALGKAMAAGTTEGLVKWIVEPTSGRLLGAQAVGSNATELIGQAALAIRNELTIDEIANTIHCHPTLSEAWMEAAQAYLGQCVHLPKPRARRKL